MRKAWYILTLALASILLCSAPSAAQEAATISTLKNQFSSVNAVANHLCVVTDNWQLAFISHDKEHIGAVFITETELGVEHDHDLNETAVRVAELIGMSSPVIQEMERAERTTAIMIDTDVMESLADEAEHIFWGTPLEGMAFLLQDGYFYIDSINPDGWLLWKTVKKSNVEILMPMAPTKLTAIEVDGRQKMNKHAAEVLARKLGLGSNTASDSTRNAVRRQLHFSDVSYMNTKSNIVGAYSGKRYSMGKRNSVSNMLANRYGGTLLYPSIPTDWPGEETEEEAEEEVKESRPLTPREARDAYVEYLRSLSSQS